MVLRQELPPAVAGHQAEIASTAEPEAAEEIIQLCGRLPLALAIVAARATAHPDFTLASIAADLRRTQGRLDAFGTAGVAADARAVFSWSYQYLSPRACRLFRLLSLLRAADITVAASASLLGDTPETASRLTAELTSTALITEHQPGRYAFHELTRAYAAELSESTDTDAERHEALARLLDHYLHSGYAAKVELKPHREPIAPGAPRPGVTPEQFSDSESAMSWFTAERASSSWPADQTPSPQHVVTWPGGVVCRAPGSGPGGLPGRRPLSRRRP